MQNGRTLCNTHSYSYKRMTKLHSYNGDGVDVVELVHNGDREFVINIEEEAAAAAADDDNDE